MKRNKEPNLGLWVAPGGKIEKHESPYECALREFYEETGLRALNMHLRGIVSLVLPQLTSPCIQFIYLVTEFSGETTADAEEGSLRWWPKSEINQLPMPDGVSLFLSHLLDTSKPIYQAKFVYNDDLKIIDVEEHPM
jgi:8-oxo-dGTP diphosphatase